MLEISDLIKIFFPKESQHSLGALALECKGALDFDARSWLDIKKDILSDTTIKLRIVRTVYEMQYRYDGVAGEIPFSLEQWSDGKIDFDFLNAADNLFYQTVYTFLGFMHFPKHRFERQVFLLGSRFLLMAYLWGLDMETNVTLFFAAYNIVDILSYNSALFAAAIANNQTKIGDSSSSYFYSISDLVSKYKSFRGDAGKDKLAGFAAQYLNGMSEEYKKIALAIISLYEKLDSGSIWRDLEYTLGLVYDKGAVPKSLDIDTYYANELKTVTSILSWLESREAVVNWLVTRPITGVKKVLSIAAKKIDLNNDKQLTLTMELLASLADKYKQTDLSKILYFDEKSSQFHWNEKIIN